MGSNDTNETSRSQSRSRGYCLLVIGGIVVAIVIAIYVWRSGSPLSGLPAESPSKWKTFVSVEGQPESVPVEWVSTPEGRFAHSIKLPEPLPADSGYREGMTAKEYWEHLCKTQAGEFIYKSVDSVEGFYFMRPPNRPTDDDLKDRYKLEAPDLERVFQLFRSTADERAKSFVRPPWATFQYVEEPLDYLEDPDHYLRMSGYSSLEKLPMQTEKVSTLKSEYGLVWRGVRRTYDRELGISGSEWIVIDLKTAEVLAVQRNFALTGWVKRAPKGTWWLTAVSCDNVTARNLDRSRYYDFVAKVLRPSAGEQK